MNKNQYKTHIHYYFANLPFRCGKLILHFFYGISFYKWWKKEWWESLLKPNILLLHIVWWATLGLKIMDCLGMGEFYTTMMRLFKWNTTRQLTDDEINLGKTIFGDNIQWKLVRIDDKAFIGPKQKKFAYVAYHTINTWEKLNDSTLLHEFVHVWQYERYGATYLLKALLAQYSKEKYNYGGIFTLKNALVEGKRFEEFNFEQQGDIVGDFHRLRTGFRPLWGNATKLDISVYEEMTKILKQQTPFK